jgi:hypothetical protein
MPSARIGRKDGRMVRHNHGELGIRKDQFALQIVDKDFRKWDEFIVKGLEGKATLWR